LAAGTCAPSVLHASNRDANFDWTLHSPEEVGMSKAGLEGIRAAMQKSVDANVVPGVVTAIARHNKLVFYEAIGMRDVAAPSPMQKDDLFDMASSTKNLTATAVMMMVEAGKLSLRDKVSRYIPTFKHPMVAVAPPGATDATQVKVIPADREITVFDLLTHTSGLLSIGDDLKAAPGSLVNKIEREPSDTLGDYVSRLGSAVLDFQPGTKCRYSPLDGFDVLLRIVEITSRTPADLFLKERILGPLDMNSTFYNVPPRLKGRVVKFYGPYNGSWPTMPPFSASPAIFGEGPTKYFSGSAGLKSTVHDFMQFEEMMLNRGMLNGHRLLQASTVADMTRNHVGSLFAEWHPPQTAGLGFGLGMAIVEDATKGNGRSVGSFGWGGGYGTETWADPELDVAGAMFIQMEPPPEKVKADLQGAVRQAIVV
jgi:CubicO group peptidase (beta-lactamase class C family)